MTRYPQLQVRGTSFRTQIDVGNPTLSCPSWITHEYPIASATNVSYKDANSSFFMSKASNSYLWSFKFLLVINLQTKMKKKFHFLGDVGQMTSKEEILLTLCCIKMQTNRKRLPYMRYSIIPWDLNTNLWSIYRQRWRRNFIF